MKSIIDSSLFRFLLVSIFYVIINSTIYYISYNLLNINYNISLIIAWFISLISTYFINTYYTFKTKPSLKSFLLYPISNIPALVFTVVLSYIFVYFGINEAYLAISTNIISIPFTYILMKYILNK